MGQTVDKEIVLPSPPGEVWAALTDEARLAVWFGAEAHLELRPGGLATFRWPDGTVRSATVEVVQDAHLLILRWLPFAEDAQGRRSPRPVTTVRFLLQRTSGGTRLKVTEAAGGGNRWFPDDQPPKWGTRSDASPSRDEPLARAAL
jgi:uncharacterized protein YndB with AHSA1/START domain